MAGEGEIGQLLEQYAPAVDVWPGERPDLMRNVDRVKDRELGWAAAPGWRDEHEPNVGWVHSLPRPLAKARNVISDTLGPYARRAAKVMHESGAGLLSNFLTPAATQGMFLTPFRVANLEQAGFIKPGGWRSLAALEQAKKAASLGMSPQDVWRRYGWNVAGNDPWGKIPGTFQVGEFAPLDTSDLRIATQGRPRAVGELISGRSADELFSADPRLRDMPIKYETMPGDGMPDGGYIAMGRRIKSGDMENILADVVPGSHVLFRNIEPGHPLFESVARHELGHAVNQSGMPGSAPAVPLAGRDIPDPYAPSSRVEDAPFYAPLARELDEMKSTSHGLRFDDPRRRDLASAINALNQARNQAEAVANYHNARHEVSAREGAERVGMTLDQQRNTPPGSIPLFTNDTLPSWAILPGSPDMVARGIGLGDLEIPYQNFRAARRGE